MKLVILDGHALNPGDLSWDAFKEFGEITLYDRTSPDKVVERIGDAELILTNKVTITDEIMSACKNLKYIGVLATGYNIIDINAAKKHGIAVTNIPSYSTRAVAQAVFAFILEFANGVHSHSESVFNGGWCASPDFCYWNHPLTELSEKTLGIFGFGDIGQNAAEIASAFNMKVVACTRSEEKIEKYNKNCADASKKVKSVSFDELLSVSDFISLHAPLTDKTKGVISSSALEKVKPSAVLINTARGPLVDEEAVCAALKEGRLAGYAADVLSVEPMRKDNPLLTAPNCVITPHVAWAAKETRQRLMGIAVENVRSFLAGSTQNLIPGL